MFSKKSKKKQSLGKLGKKSKLRKSKSCKKHKNESKQSLSKMSGKKLLKRKLTKKKTNKKNNKIGGGGNLREIPWDKNEGNAAQEESSDSNIIKIAIDDYLDNPSRSIPTRDQLIKYERGYKMNIPDEQGVNIQKYIRGDDGDDGDHRKGTCQCNLHAMIYHEQKYDRPWQIYCISTKKIKCENLFDENIVNNYDIVYYFNELINAFDRLRELNGYQLTSEPEPDNKLDIDDKDNVVNNTIDITKCETYVIKIKKNEIIHSRISLHKRTDKSTSEELYTNTKDSESNEDFIRQMLTEFKNKQPEKSVINLSVDGDGKYVFKILKFD